jgi:hypothetical protein
MAVKQAARHLGAHLTMAQPLGSGERGGGTNGKMTKKLSGKQICGVSLWTVNALCGAGEKISDWLPD